MRLPFAAIIAQLPAAVLTRLAISGLIIGSLIGYGMPIPIMPISVNYFSTFHFGTLPAILALLLWRDWRGFAIGALAAILSWLLWDQQWIQLIAVGELFVLTIYLLQSDRRIGTDCKGRIIICDSIFWLAFGIPSTLLVSGFLLQVDFSQSLLLGLNLGLNGLLNTTLAYALFLVMRLIPFTKRGRYLSLHGGIVTMVLLSISLPLILLVTASSRELVLLVEEELSATMGVVASAIASSSHYELQKRSEMIKHTITSMEFRRADQGGYMFSSNPQMFQRLEGGYRSRRWFGLPPGLEILLPHEQGQPHSSGWMEGYWRFKQYFDANGAPTNKRNSTISVEVAQPAKPTLMRLNNHLLRLSTTFFLICLLALIISHKIGKRLAHEIGIVAEPLTGNRQIDWEDEDSYLLMPTLHLSGIAEFRELARRMNENILRANCLTAKLSIVNKDLLASQDKFEILSETDDLTSCLNRRALSRCLPESIRLCSKDQAPLSMIFFDIDAFKAINDQYGHQIGDQVICNVVEVVQSRLREQDTLFRMGGDEFLILLPRCSVENAMMVADALRERVKDTFLEKKILFAKKVTISAGVSSFDYRTDDLDAILIRLDRALYDAKRAGRDRVVFST